MNLANLLFLCLATFLTFLELGYSILPQPESPERPIRRAGRRGRSARRARPGTNPIIALDPSGVFPAGLLTKNLTGDFVRLELPYARIENHYTRFFVAIVDQHYWVSVCDINCESGEELVNALGIKYGKNRVMFSQCDVTDYCQFEESFETTLAAFGRLDIVVNNAGIMNDRFWELEVDVNLNGVIRGTLLAQRYLAKDRGYGGGVVINTGSNVSINPYVSAPIYSATKSAIVSLTRAFGDDYHVDLTGVRVMALCPSATESNLVRDVGKQLLSPRYEDAWRRDTASCVTQK
ncbi:15-hydroxyprostaglandin dehydrogenase [NAD(+)]-like [Belonocnema kinseyi]|uniref:15-hydroxyprostaglandin dehydrogenase [NAD(+)]-like n=1 Tax=Belonocnema kinseyi TaxID=2817044 RepID=UPI00143D45B1|nr:15-hydroxyprostaglandin dehydrogenase [NAD(+)]-like [Belonocnema kinseyi]